MTHLQRRAGVIASTRRDQTAIVGVRTTACGALYRNLDPARHPSLEVPAAVCRTAVEDAGLATKAVGCMSSGLGNISG